MSTTTLFSRLPEACAFIKTWLDENYEGFEGDWDSSILENYVQDFTEFHSAMKRSDLINIPREYQKFFNYGALYDEMTALGEINVFYTDPVDGKASLNEISLENSFPGINCTWILEEHFIDCIRDDIKRAKTNPNGSGSIVWKKVPKDDIRRMRIAAEEECSDSCDCITAEEVAIASSPSCEKCGAPTEIAVSGDTDCLNTICPAGVMVA